MFTTIRSPSRQAKNANGFAPQSLVNLVVSRLELETLAEGNFPFLFSLTPHFIFLV
jgi:hypothetical protein